MQRSNGDRWLAAAVASWVAACGGSKAEKLPEVIDLHTELAFHGCDIEGDDVYLIGYGRAVKLDRTTREVTDITSDVEHGNNIFRLKGRTIFVDTHGVYSVADGQHVRTTIAEDLRSSFGWSGRIDKEICWQIVGENHSIDCLGPDDTKPVARRSGSVMVELNSPSHVYAFQWKNPAGAAYLHDISAPIVPVITVAEVSLSGGEDRPLVRFPYFTPWIVWSATGLVWQTPWHSALQFRDGTITTIGMRSPGGWDRLWSRAGALWLHDAYGWSMADATGRVRRVLLAQKSGGPICADERSLFASVADALVEIRLDQLE